jgi:ATP-binding cassette, subfamily B, bacterial
VSGSAPQAPPRALAPFLWRLMRPQRWAFVALFCCNVWNVLESNVVPYSLKLMIDAATRAGAGSDGRQIVALAGPVALFFAAWIVAALIWRIQELLFAYTMPKFEGAIRLALFEHLAYHSHAYYSANLSGTIASKLNSLPRAARGLIDIARGVLLPSLLVVLAAIVLLGAVSLFFSAIIVIWVALHLVLVHKAAGRATAASNRHAQDDATLNGEIVDALTNMATVRLFSQQRSERKRIEAFQQLEQDSQREALLAILRSRGPPDVLLIGMYAVTLISIVIAWSKGAVSAGDIVLILVTLFNVMSLVWTAGAQASHIFRSIGECNQALSLIGEKHQIADPRGAKELVVKQGEIVFDNVCFQYAAGGVRFATERIVIRPGEKVGLVGYSGSGKTTFLRLLMRLYDLQCGSILIDDQNVAEVTQESLRAAISVTPQDAPLFHRSVMDNIRYGRPDASDEEVIYAARVACCHEFILKMESSYQTTVGERGVKLSEGQRQRISIARAILKRAPIFVLDEATSALDSVTEAQIQEGLTHATDGRTTIVIAHRFSTLAAMDRILVFEEGRIVEDGSHAKLVEAGRHYAKLWRSQVGGLVPNRRDPQEFRSPSVA